MLPWCATRVAAVHAVDPLSAALKLVVDPAVALSEALDTSIFLFSVARFGLGQGYVVVIRVILSLCARTRVR